MSNSKRRRFSEIFSRRKETPVDDADTMPSSKRKSKRSSKKVKVRENTVKDSTTTEKIPDVRVSAPQLGATVVLSPLKEAREEEEEHAVVRPKSAPVTRSTSHYSLPKINTTTTTATITTPEELPTIPERRTPTSAILFSPFPASTVLKSNKISLTIHFLNHQTGDFTLEPVHIDTTILSIKHYIQTEYGHPISHQRFFFHAHNTSYYEDVIENNETVSKLLSRLTKTRALVSGSCFPAVPGASSSKGHVNSKSVNRATESKDKALPEFIPTLFLIIKPPPVTHLENLPDPRYLTTIFIEPHPSLGLSHLGSRFDIAASPGTTLSEIKQAIQQATGKTEGILVYKQRLYFREKMLEDGTLTMLTLQVFDGAVLELEEEEEEEKEEKEDRKSDGRGNVNIRGGEGIDERDWNFKGCSDGASWREEGSRWVEDIR